MNTLRELLINNREPKLIKLYVDNDIVFGVDENEKFNMHPEDALFEALELLGFSPEAV
jgi:hypothetical protein